VRKITIAGIRRRLGRYSMLARAGLISYLEDGTLPGRQRTASPVDFIAWLRRGAGRKASGHPDSWRVDPQLPLEDPSRIAVLVHVFYVELLDELLAALHAIPVGFDLVVTNASDVPIRIDRSSIANLRNVVLFDVHNHGRDIFPLVQVVNAGILDPYEVVLKLHTKKSAWREGHAELQGTGASWKDEFLEALAGSREMVEGILDAFAADPWLGLVTAPGNVVGPEFWGGDEAITRELLRRLELDVDHDALRFAAGSMYWVRAFVLQGLRSLNLTGDDFDEEKGQIDGTTAHAIERAIGILTQEAGLRLTTTDALGAGDGTGSWARYALTAPRTPAVRFVPFYLPQFHPTHENDVWWGKGFTEWTNVTAARPVYRGHHQPKLPADLGFYDLRLEEVRQAQTELAAEHGIDGFMYYYYWFAGQRLLNLPIERLLAGSTPMPYCIMWANENWTRRWDGRSSDVLIGQDYDRVPAQRFIDDVMPFLKDERYLRVGDKPVLAVYRPAQMDDFREVVASWRRRAREEGLGELVVLAVAVAREFHGVGADFREHGLDGILHFPPHNLPWAPGPTERLAVAAQFKGNLMSYEALVEAAEARLRALDDGEHPGVMVTFDNTARRQWRPDIWYGSNPYTFRRWAGKAASAVMHRPPEERFVFVNAWNEWAEGAILEPTDRFGKTYLQALRDVAFG
jgi:lipopolysaccharide biosynthesis protein